MLGKMCFIYALYFLFPLFDFLGVEIYSKIDFDFDSLKEIKKEAFW